MFELFTAGELRFTACPRCGRTLRDFWTVCGWHDNGAQYGCMGCAIKARDALHPRAGMSTTPTYSNLTRGVHARSERAKQETQDRHLRAQQEYRAGQEKERRALQEFWDGVATEMESNADKRYMLDLAHADPRISRTTRLILLALFGLTDNSGDAAQVSLGFLAKHCEIAESRVASSIKHLIALGILSKRRPHKGGGPNIYSLL